MANIPTLNAPSVSTDVISSSDGTPVLDISSAPEVYVRRHVLQTDTTDRTSGNSWTLGPTFTELTGFQANSKLHLFYSVPMRNDDAGWGGGYIEPQISINGGAWQSLGSCGYDGGVMGYGKRIITYRNHLLIDPGQTATFSVQFRFYFRSYSGTVQWNDSRDIGLTSGTATELPGLVGGFHSHINVREIARVRA